MTTFVSLLRAVNVGGHNKINMEALRGLYESLNLRTPKTYVQSGNVVFRSEEGDAARVTALIENGIERHFGFRTQVILRTCAEMRNVVAKNPFSTRDDIHPGKLLVTFLAADPGPAARERLRAVKADPEELRMDGREVYIYFPNGMGRAKLSPALLAKTLATAGTGRNWNSVTKLLDIAQNLDARP